MMYKFHILLLLVFSAPLYSQDSSATFYTGEGKIFVDAGLMFNRPFSERGKSEYIRYNFIPDLNLDFGYLLTNAEHHGWMFIVGCSTKNYAFTILEKDASNGESSFAFNNFYAHFTINKTFDFDITKNTNIMMAAGPAVIVNPRVYGSDSLSSYSPQEVELDDIKGIGATVNFAVHLVRKVKNKKYVFLKASYQRGFVDFMEARITNHTYGVRRNFFYNGTGPSLKFGVIF